MSLIFRYLLRQFLGPLFVCLVAFNGIFILFDLFGHLSKFLDAGLGFFAVVRYYAGVASAYAHWFIPASCMLATLYSMWQLSHHSELTAMRASGISFHRLTLPFFSVAFAMSLLTFANLEWISPRLATWSDRLKDNDYRLDGDGPVRRDRPFTFGDREWVFEAADWTSDEAMAHPPGRVAIRSETRGRGGEPDVRWGVRAARAEWLDGEWWLEKPVFMHFDADGSEISGSDLGGAPLPDWMPFPELTETPHDMVLSRKAGESATLPLRDMLRLIRSKGENAEPEDWYGFWYRVAAPWACLVITLFAIPAGITTGRQSVFKGVILVLATFFGFYFFTIALSYFGQGGAMSPALAAWLPDAVFLCVGVAMYGRLT
ncbi:MAG: LptF/LptG family permease [Kiritimatiellae bacterium]|nr:LptF/LptG family permease [Kiritimatiellia bacterium]